MRLRWTAKTKGARSDAYRSSSFSSLCILMAHSLPVTDSEPSDSSPTRRHT